RGELRVRIEQVLFQVRDEIVSGDALKSESIEIAFQELIEAFASESLFQEPQKERALLVRHKREAVVRMASGEDYVQNFVRVRQTSHLFFQVLKRERRFHLFALEAVNRLGDAAFQISREAFVEPEITPRRVGHQIA